MKNYWLMKRQENKWCDALKVAAEDVKANWNLVKFKGKFQDAAKPSKNNNLYPTNVLEESISRIPANNECWFSGCGQNRGKVPNITEVFNMPVAPEVVTTEKPKKRGSILQGFPPSNTISPTIHLTDADLTYTPSWWHPIKQELPQGQCSAVMQVKICPKTGIKHNLASLDVIDKEWV